ncbi:MAG: CoA protein activase [Dethiobacteria bacterium]|nr:CoA protein activase [Dethiobacteria bacterium]
MKVSFGHMGTLTPIMEMILEDLGHESITPDRPTRQTLALGAKYAPEFACIPFKIVLGTYLEGLKRGADTLASGGGYGPCRAGLYGELHGRILRDLGHEFDFIFFWPPLKKPHHFFKQLQKLKGNNSWAFLWRTIKKAYRKLAVLDELELLSQRMRPRELKQGETSKAFTRAVAIMRRAKSEQEIVIAGDEARSLMHSVPINEKRQPLKVGIIGEIYVQLEPFANFFLEEQLGHMGVEVRRSIYLTSYAQHDVLSTKGDVGSRILAMPYLAQKVGGHGQNSVGDIIRYAKEGYNGVVQLAPFSCIPEIVAKSLVPQLSKDYGIPVLTLFIDEQTGAAGVQTRLEAFVDLMEQRRSRDLGLGA